MIKFHLIRCRFRPNFTDYLRNERRRETPGWRGEQRRTEGGPPRDDNALSRCTTRSEATSTIEMLQRALRVARHEEVLPKSAFLRSVYRIIAEGAAVGKILLVVKEQVVSGSCDVYAHFLLRRLDIDFRLTLRELHRVYLTCSCIFRERDSK